VAKGSDLDRVTAIVLREMRAPLMVLVVAYAVGIGVMMLIPGIDGEPMSAFHAFYFMTYTATTTGFGELPQEFSDAQRLWAIVCLYMSVIAWIYGIGSIIKLVQNPHFTLAIAQARFARTVKLIREPFYIICGFGDTGSLLARGLSDRRIPAVIIDADVERIKALDLRAYSVPMPGLKGDASVPKNLSDAGIDRPECKGVVLLTGDEDINLKIAVMVRLLNPQAEVICRSTSHAHEEELIGLGHVTLVDPFEVWARELGLAVHLPELHTLDEWLVGAHGVTLERLIAYPRGTWILCGYGKLGKTLYTALTSWGLHTVVIDPNIDEDTDVGQHVTGLATRSNLVAAGVDNAAGVIAATNSDSDNLAILLTARSLNKNVHLIVRQNDHENELAFNAASADLIMQPSLVTARRLLLQLISPLIQELLNYLEANPEILRDKLLPSLRTNVPTVNPALWSICLDDRQAPALAEFKGTNRTLSLGDALRDPQQRSEQLNCVALLISRGRRRYFLPDLDLLLETDDEILLCSTHEVQQKLRASLDNIYTLQYLATGEVPTRGYLLRWMNDKPARSR
jgi:Trk K+ transport system NAD-binding subunit